VTEEELKLFSLLLFDHKHLWIAFQETKYLREFPNADPKDAHIRFVNAAAEVYLPLENALLSRRPIRDIGEILQTIFLASTIAQSEGKVY
jgi:hypothetical protein